MEQHFFRFLKEAVFPLFCSGHVLIIPLHSDIHDAKWQEECEFHVPCDSFRKFHVICYRLVNESHYFC
jgi:hypothetical protein